MPRKSKKQVKISPQDLEKLHRVHILALALQGIDKAMGIMDAVYFNPTGYLEMRDEIKDKIVSLLQEMELGE